MSELGALRPQALRDGLARGISLQTGRYRTRIRSHDDRVARNLAVLYAGFPWSDDSGFRDFHVEIDRVHGPRRWLRPQVNVWVDGVAPFKPLPAEQSFAMLEWGLNWCIATHTMDALVLHAAVLERDGVCLLMPGEPGAGKSTLSAALMLAGWRLLSDELAIVGRDGQAQPIARPVSLKNASIDIIRRRHPDAVFGETTHDTHKGTVSHLRPTPPSVAGMLEPARPTHLLFPKWHARSSLRLRPRGKADTLMRLAKHAFNYSLLGREGFEIMAGLVDGCHCLSLSYADLDEALPALAALRA